MNEYYEAIMELSGQEQLKNLVRKWNRVAEYQKNRNKKKDILIPNLLFHTQSGIGNSKIISLLANYIESENLLEFYGDVTHYQFLLEYCEPHREMKELTRLIDEVNHVAAGFRNEYKG